MQELLKLYKKSDAEITEIENQYDKVHLIPWIEKKNTVAFWNEVRCYSDASGLNPFQELVDFALSVLVLPYSNATVERIFSQMNIVKNKQRNRMETFMVNAILTVRFGLRRHKKCCKDYTFPKEVLQNIRSTSNYQTSKDLPTPEMDEEVSEIEELVAMLNATE